ncbi:light-inducible protein CPRF2-like isoform X2 [Euphorbia lathyris]|uniref:light-inducible protein CPRF2-like isoform X2 n=1 Tax=Euphorbia lathyris TaxID=212925 RepID=UPI003313100F
MNSIFSVDDISDLLWQGPMPSPAMTRSPSEWELEKFLEEFPAPASSSATDNPVSRPSLVSQSSTSSKPRNVDDDVVEIGKPEIPPLPLCNRLQQPLDRAPLDSTDSDEYRAFLKSQLHLACAAAAKSRDSSVKPEVISSVAEDQRIATKNCQLESQVSGDGPRGPEVSKSQSEVDGGSVSIPALSPMLRIQEVSVRQTTSGSSREDSDDDDLEGDTETNEQLGPSDEKRARRMQSNRESARRSRRRKQAQLSELETQVGQLRDERTTLLTRLTDINKKCDDASVDHRILNANIETLRTKGHQKILYGVALAY